MKSLILPWVCSLAVLMGCAQMPANPPESTPSVTSEEAANKPAEEPAAMDPEPAQADRPELLHLWDEFGQFRQEFWESKTHDERVHALTVLSERGNEGASRALGRLENRTLSGSDLVRFGNLIAKGGYGNETFPHDGAPSRPLGKIPRIKLPEDAYPPEMIPTWQHPSRSLLEDTAKKGLPVVIYFHDLLDGDEFIADEELADLSRSEAIFFKFQITGKLEHPPWHEASVVPASRLLSDDPSRDYGVAVLRPRIIVADSWGNEFFRLTRKPNAGELRAYFERVQELAQQTNDKLQKNLDLVFEHLAKQDRRKALKYMLKNFREDVVGMQAQEDTIQVYRDLIEAASKELEDLVAKGDKMGLQALAKEMRGSDLEREIDAALEKLK